MQKAYASYQPHAVDRARFVASGRRRPNRSDTRVGENDVPGALRRGQLGIPLRVPAGYDGVVVDAVQPAARQMAVLAGTRRGTPGRRRRRRRFHERAEPSDGHLVLVEPERAHGGAHRRILSSPKGSTRDERRLAAAFVSRAAIERHRAARRWVRPVDGPVDLRIAVDPRVLGSAVGDEPCVGIRAALTDAPAGIADDGVHARSVNAGLERIAADDPLAVAAQDDGERELGVRQKVQPSTRDDASGQRVRGAFLIVAFLRRLAVVTQDDLHGELAVVVAAGRDDEGADAPRRVACPRRDRRGTGLEIGADASDLGRGVRDFAAWDVGRELDRDLRRRAAGPKPARR